MRRLSILSRTGRGQLDTMTGVLFDTGGTGWASANAADLHPCRQSSRSSHQNGFMLLTINGPTTPGDGCSMDAMLQGD